MSIYRVFVLRQCFHLGEHNYGPHITGIPGNKFKDIVLHLNEIQQTFTDVAKEYAGGGGEGGGGL